MNSKRAVEKSGPTTLPIHPVNIMPVQQAAEPIIRSIDSSTDGQGSMLHTDHGPGGKVEAYVDFSDFNKNYHEYLRRTSKSKQNPEASDINIKVDTNEDNRLVLGRSSSNSSQSTEEWVVLS